LLSGIDLNQRNRTDVMGIRLAEPKRPIAGSARRAL
jgi:hypothetical protein